MTLAIAACSAGATTEPSPNPTPPESMTVAPSMYGDCSCPCPSAAPARAPASTSIVPAVPAAAVELTGKPFFVRASDEADIRRCQGIVVDPETVTDGLFLSAQQCWDEGAVWWEEVSGDSSWEAGDGSAAADRWIEVELAGAYMLREAIVQADNNDAYLLSYRDPGTGDWLPLWTVPPAYSFGMATRPDPLDDTQRQTLPKIVTTDAVRIEAEFGDGMYSVSEIQLFGERAGG
jgi:hypothetical protein